MLVLVLVLLQLLLLLFTHVGHEGEGVAGFLRLRSVLRLILAVERSCWWCSSHRGITLPKHRAWRRRSNGSGNVPVARAYPVATAVPLDAARAFVPDAFFAQQRAINAAYDRNKIERNMVAAAREREEDALGELRRQTSVSYLTSFFGICIAAT